MKEGISKEVNNIAERGKDKIIQENSEKFKGVQELKAKGYSESDGLEILRIGSALGVNFDEHPSAFHHLSLLEDLDRSASNSSRLSRYIRGKDKFLSKTSFLKFHKKCALKIYKRKLEGLDRSVGAEQVNQ